MISDIMRRISMLNTLKNPTEKELEELEFYKALMKSIIVIFRSKNYSTLIPINLSNCSLLSAKEFAEPLGLHIVESKNNLYLLFTKEVEILYPQSQP